jgi:CheY-like chemotaxis protein/anti-sigma regulatory factor (Ser/Thr protein kinase)
MADPTRLQQIVWNLLSNAVKFTPKGGTIDVSARRTSSQIQIAVTDNGEGIDPNFIPHVFEPFRQAEDPRTRVHGGLGLGLSIVRYLVEAQGGSVTAESSGKGKGSTFTVALPIAATTALPPEYHRQAATAAPSKNRLAGLRVLLVDDDREARHLVHSVLHSAGANVTAVESATYALNELGSATPDVIITDIAMPHMDGYEFARRVRSEAKLASVKLIALTAFPFASEAARQSGFDDYLMKPIDPFVLIDSVARAVGGTAS